MPRFAANLSMMLNEWSFLDRFAVAADAGFKGVEFLFPYDFAPEQVSAAARKAGVEVVLFNLPPGAWDRGDRGLACRAERAEEFRDGVERALVYARELDVPRLHCMAGIGDRHDSATAGAFRDAIAWAADRLAADGRTLLIEPINPRDMPGYFLNDFGHAADLIAGLARPNLKLQFDIYHRQIIHGDVIMALRAFAPIIGHVQVASVPLRHEPGTGELNDRRVFAELDGIGYDGWVGCEYRPAGATLEGLGWLETHVSQR